ncbi:hypothetical protein BBM40_23555 [Vibrio parahaemolyticus]|nr:hypothetical protein BBM40_23555 [Vibrio parahaemolyticus]
MAAGGSIPSVSVFLVALVVLVFIRSFSLSVQTINQEEEQLMNKVKTTAIFSTLETIWAIGVSCTAGALSPYAHSHISYAAQESIKLKG